ncbi:hypothetical protein JD844_005765 [Phrynosoma platyrhinos]|uniref:Uncharacterized protein n=1 Tax=Phrynosoma platyrhinos TaxID=52577 RepID=A0ABQ7TNP4_PHRPL|nr:hypothetical protein JD844_005765 [Phrynosoma platyrhinos]
METCPPSLDRCGIILSEINLGTPMDTTPNGLVCPACFQVNDFECKQEEELQCTGDQNNCLAVTGTATRGN